MENCQRRGNFDFGNPQFTYLYHKNSSNRTDFYQDSFFLVPKTVLLKEFLYMIHFLIEILTFQVPALIPTNMESLKVVRLDDQSQAKSKFLTLFWMDFESVHGETCRIIFEVTLQSLTIAIVFELIY